MPFEVKRLVKCPNCAYGDAPSKGRIQLIFVQLNVCFWAFSSNLETAKDGSSNVLKETNN